MNILAELRDLCDVYPVTYMIMITCAIVCLIPSVLLLTAVLRSSIHSNCRILMCLWLTAQLLTYAIICWLAAYSISSGDKYYKENFIPSKQDAYILIWYLSIWHMSTCFELGISLERGLSIYSPSKYSGSTTAYAMILTFFIFSVLFSFRIGSWILSGTDKAAIGTFLSNLMDIAAFATNIIVWLLSRRKSNSEHKQLNESYQIREAYSIARAMIPVYCISTSLKIVMMAINWMFVAKLVPHTVSEVVYISISELICGLTSSMFIRHHVRLRSKLDGVLGPSSNVFSIGKHQEDTIHNHFEMLQNAWN